MSPTTAEWAATATAPQAPSPPLHGGTIDRPFRDETEAMYGAV